MSQNNVYLPDNEVLFVMLKELMVRANHPPLEFTPEKKQTYISLAKAALSGHEYVRSIKNMAGDHTEKYNSTCYLIAWLMENIATGKNSHKLDAMYNFAKKETEPGEVIESLKRPRLEEEESRKRVKTEETNRQLSCNDQVYLDVSSHDTGAHSFIHNLVSTRISEVILNSIDDVLVKGNLYLAPGRIYGENTSSCKSLIEKYGLVPSDINRMTDKSSIRKLCDDMKKIKKSMFVFDSNTASIAGGTNLGYKKIADVLRMLQSIDYEYKGYGNLKTLSFDELFKLLVERWFITNLLYFFIEYYYRNNPLNKKENKDINAAMREFVTYHADLHEYTKKLGQFSPYCLPNA